MLFAKKSGELYYYENGNMKKMSIATGNIIPVPQLSNAINGFAIASDGSFAIYRDKSKYNIQIVNLLSGASLTIHNQYSDRFVISPDDKKVLWISSINSDNNPFTVQDIVLP
jgi:hypothetical protein